MPAFVSDLLAWAAADQGSRLAAGLQRSYGDSGLFSTGRLILTPGLDRVLSFDTASGIIRAQAGLSLDALLRLVVPHGWFVAVTPGTRWVTLGGAVANDVHGKNHTRAGTFGCHVKSLTLLRSFAPPVEIGPDDSDGLFGATIGGLGLTGIILDVTLQLAPIRSAYLDAEIFPLADLAEFFDLNARSLESHEHTVAWIDCTRSGADIGRGVYTRANWAESGGLTPHPAKSRRVPIEAPGFTLNRTSLRLFNQVYRALQLRKPARSRMHYGDFFHPLDSLAEWNKLYGPAGFYQYQCVVPGPAGPAALREMLAAIGRSGEGSALIVLKRFGDRASPGLLSFPRPGFTLALDFKNRGAETLALLARLDTITRTAGGALYPAKDGRVPRAMFEFSFPKLQQFLRFRDPACGSDFMTRMGF